jgi:hypothetical protein
MRVLEGLVPASHSSSVGRNKYPSTVLITSLFSWYSIFLFLYCNFSLVCLPATSTCTSFSTASSKLSFLLNLWYSYNITSTISTLAHCTQACLHPTATSFFSVVRYSRTHSSASRYMETPTQPSATLLPATHLLT